MARGRSGLFPNCATDEWMPLTLPRRGSLPLPAFWGEGQGEGCPTIGRAHHAHSHPNGLAALCGGHGSVGLDLVVEAPPAPERKLFALPNIILTPHMPGPSWKHWKKAVRNSIDNIRLVVRSEKPL